MTRSDLLAGIRKTSQVLVAHVGVALMSDPHINTLTTPMFDASIKERATGGTRSEDLDLSDERLRIDELAG